MADALIAAVAKLASRHLVHKDPEFEAIASQVSILNLPFTIVRQKFIGLSQVALGHSLFTSTSGSKGS